MRMMFCHPKPPCPRGATFTFNSEAAVSSFLIPLRAAPLFSSLNPQEGFQGSLLALLSLVFTPHLKCGPGPSATASAGLQQPIHCQLLILAHWERKGSTIPMHHCTRSGSVGTRQAAMGIARKVPASRVIKCPLFAQSGGAPDGMAWELSSEQARMMMEQPLLCEKWER